MSKENKEKYKGLLNKKLGSFTEDDKKEFAKLQVELSKQGLSSCEMDELMEVK